MTARVYSTSRPSSRLAARRRMRAADIPEVLACADRRTHLGYSAFIKEWHWWPGDRKAMISDRPVSDDHNDLCRIAAVVHALCAKDRVRVPEWVFDYRSGAPLAMISGLPTTGCIWDRVVAEACGPCEYHNVWFSYRDIESLPEAAKRIKRTRRRRRWRHMLRR